MLNTECKPQTIAALFLKTDAGAEAVMIQREDYPIRLKQETKKMT